MQAQQLDQQRGTQRATVPTAAAEESPLPVQPPAGAQSRSTQGSSRGSSSRSGSASAETPPETDLLTHSPLQRFGLAQRISASLRTPWRQAQTGSGVNGDAGSSPAQQQQPADSTEGQEQTIAALEDEVGTFVVSSSHPPCIPQHTLTLFCSTEPP